MRSFISYETIIEEEARDFVNDNEDTLVEAIGDELDFHDIDDLDRSFHETITDRSYSTDDASFIIENSNNVESDRGLTEGMDHDDALSAKAAYTFSNDVREKVQEIYDGIVDDISIAEANLNIDDPEPIAAGDKFLKEFVSRDDGGLKISAAFDAEMNFESVLVESASDKISITAQNVDSVEVLDPTVIAVVKAILEEDGDPGYDNVRKAFVTASASKLIEKMIEDAKPTPIEPGSEEERTELLAWLRAARRSSRGGYPLGHAYIDARCGHMYGSSEHAYVVSEGELAQRLPHLFGKSTKDVKAYWDETFGGPTPSNAEEMLVKIRRMIQDGEGNPELRDIVPEIDGVLDTNAPKP